MPDSDKMTGLNKDVVLEMTPMHTNLETETSDFHSVTHEVIGNGSKGPDDVVTVNEVDGRVIRRKLLVEGKENSYASKKSVAEGMMDIALLTANANQLRFLITYNLDSKTFYISTGLIILSLILQIAVGIALIFKRQMKIKGRRSQANRTNEFLVGGVFLVTVINVFVAAFTITNQPPDFFDKKT